MPWVETKADRARDKARRVLYAERATVKAALEDAGMGVPADGELLTRLGRRLCEIEDDLGVPKERA